MGKGQSECIAARRTNNCLLHRTHHANLTEHKLVVQPLLDLLTVRFVSAGCVALALAFEIQYLDLLRGCAV
jgi:hypothetical protein